VDTWVTPLTGRVFDWRYLLHLVRLIRQERVRLVQTHLLGAGIYGGMAAAMTGVPCVSTFHGMWDLRHLHRLRWAKARILRRASKVVLVSDSLRLEVDRLLPALGNAVVIPNGIGGGSAGGRETKTSLRRALGVPEDGFLVGAVGNVRPAKGFDHLLQAAAILLRRRSDYRFVVIGEGSGELFERLKALRGALNLDHAFTFLGFRPDAARLMGAFDVYVCSSISEGFSLSTLEALAAEVPVVATRSGGPAEILEHNRTGLLVDVASPDQVAAAVEFLRENGDYARMLVDAGRRETLDRYSLEAMVHQYRHLYGDVLTAVR
jgi:glycosyltransferase involved in cell wall biosynthesis